MNNSQPVAPTGLDSRDRHRLLADGMQQCADDVSAPQILSHLVAGGFTPAEARASLTAIERQLHTKRQGFKRTRTRTMVISLLQIVAAMMMIDGGIATGRIPTVLLGIGLLVLAAKRLYDARGLVFGASVLANRRLVQQ